VAQRTLKEKEYVYFVPREKGFVSEFFSHMLAYGGFSFNDGVMMVWGDPSVFLPARAFVHLYAAFRKERRDADAIFHWVGTLTGRNATLVLMKKFGFDKHQLPDFVNGATQDGFGYMEIKKMKWDHLTLTGELVGTNSSFALAYKKSHGKQKAAVDSYIGGILEGGAEPLFDLNLKVVETSCMACGDRLCTYSFTTLPAHVTPAFFRDLPFKEADVIAISKRIALRRKLNFQLFRRKDVEFGNGSFVLRSIKGFNMVVYVLMLLDAIAFEFFGKEKFSTLQDEMAKIIVDETFKPGLKAPLSGQAINRVLEQLMIVSLGRIQAVEFSAGKVIIMNTSNPYSTDVRDLLHTEDHSIGLLAAMIKHAFKAYFGRTVTTKVLSKKPLKSYILVKLG
jgi:hypothetical protein